MISAPDRKYFLHGNFQGIKMNNTNVFPDTQIAPQIKISIIGRGAWGNALAAFAERTGHKVVVNPADADLWLAAVPAEYFRGHILAAKGFHDGQPIIICTKGMEPNTHLFMSEVLDEILPAAKAGVLSGPQFAAEVAAGIPTGSTLAGPAAVRKIGRVAFRGFYLEETGDIIGAEVCGCGKNAAAIVAGFYSVRASGENERAMMLSRAWAEVADFGAKIGAKMRTFIGLCGTGDLFLSATSKTSRNYSAGINIARGEQVGGTVEGLPALCGIVARAREAGIPTPVLESVLAEIAI
jgi:glycerol-3-phosphate dehydrogenase (NAD(P)+)